MIQQEADALRGLLRVVDTASVTLSQDGEFSRARFILTLGAGRTKPSGVCIFMDGESSDMALRFFMGKRSVFFRRLQTAKTAVKREVIDDFEAARCEKWQAQQPGVEKNTGQQGEQVAPTVREIPVTPAAAERSAGSTTAIT